MILVITSEQSFPNETDVINQLFREGLDLLHIRKPLLSSVDMDRFIHKIDERYHTQLVLHSHYNLIHHHKIGRLHFNERDREQKGYTSLMNNKGLISTSVHTIETFNTLDRLWHYAFMSPFFESISKNGYGVNTTISQDVKKRTNYEVKLIALGGIQKSNIQYIKSLPIDGFALLGAIWQSKNPLKTFTDCRNIINNRLS